MADILIIDDDKVYRTLLHKVLTSEGYTVDTFEDGKRGVENFRKNPTSLVITDIIMPGQDGLETIALLCDEFPDVKIIAISAGGVLEPELHLKFAAGLGACSVFAKPLHFVEFLATVKELTNRSLTERENNYAANTCNESTPSPTEEKITSQKAPIRWTPDLQVGIEEIDDQHQRIFCLLAEFSAKLQKGTDSEILGKTLENLRDYYQDHFILEEFHLRNHPDLILHRHQHYSFVKKINQFEREYLDGNISLSDSIISNIENWLFKHIARTDKNQFRYLEIIHKKSSTGR